MLEDGSTWVAVGRIVRPHGIYGGLVVESWTDFPERFAPEKILYLRNAAGTVEPVQIDAVRFHRGRYVLHLKGLDTVEAVEPLRGQEFCVRPDDVPERPSGYFFHHELEGCAVLSTSGQVLGTVKGLAEAAGQPLLEVETPAGLRDVPFRHPIIVLVDLPSRSVVVDPPQGLLN